MEIITNNLRLLVMDNFEEFGKKVDGHLKLMRGVTDPNATFIAPTRLTRFASGEGKGEILESIRGKETYILTDVMNHSCTYEMHGYLNHKSPDDHYQDLKRVISAMDGAEDKLTVIMPFIYEGRQHKRKGRESKDCSLMLQELESLGVDSFITFDAHDPSIRNSLHSCSFDSIYPTYSILKEFIENEPIELDNFLVASPDMGAIERAKCYAEMLNTPFGFCYKRRDMTRVVNGKNPIIAHEYLGTSVEGKNVIVVDDMIASGQSMLEVAEQLKDRGAANIYLIASFALFSDGQKSIDAFNEAYQNGVFKRCYTSNLCYIPEEARKQEWLKTGDNSKYVAKLIDTLNKHESISPLLDSKSKILTKVRDLRGTKD